MIGQGVRGVAASAARLGRYSVNTCPLCSALALWRMVWLSIWLITAATSPGLMWVMYTCVLPSSCASSCASVVGHCGG